MITLEANYSKKIGLPGYSSHQYSVSLKTELADVTQVQTESARLYAVLQQSVDNNIQQVGFLPNGNGNGNGNGHSNGHTNGNGNCNGHPPMAETDRWNCSDKQKELILKIVTEHKLDKTKIEQLALDRFAKGVKALNKLEASGLIEELLVQTGQSKPRNARFSQPKAGAR
jgi:hypothetical protein